MSTQRVLTPLEVAEMFQNDDDVDWLLETIMRPLDQAMMTMTTMSTKRDALRQARC